MHNSRNRILQWVEDGRLEKKNVEKALILGKAEPTSIEWLDFLKISLLWLAVISLSSGIIFFFAYNWQDMGRFTKFALVESTMLISTLAYVRIAKTKLLTSATLMAMTLFTGALLALFGQTYQTGADPWQLFATWSFLILPWAIIAKANSLWILWVILVNLSFTLYVDISNGLFGYLLTEETAIWIFAISNSVLLTGFELNTIRESKKMIDSDELSNDQSYRFVNQFLAVIAGVAVTTLALWSIFEYKQNPSGIFFYIVWISAVFYVFRYKIKDLFILSAGSLSVITVIVSLLIKSIDNGMDEGGFLLIAFVIVGLSTITGIWLKKLAQEFKTDRMEELS